MKRFNFLFLVIGMALIFSGCSKEDFLAPDLSQNNQASSFKKATVKNYFTGISSSLNEEEDGIAKLLPNGKTLVKGFYTVWYDQADSEEDWRVTGTTRFYVEQKIEEDGTFKYWGKAELIVDGENEGDPSRGMWDMTWHGYLTYTPMGPNLIAYAVGQGKSGEVKGMVAKWIYTFDFVNGVYLIEGYYK